MTKKSNSEDKAMRDEKAETKKKAAPSVKSALVTIENAIEEIERQFDSYIQNVGAGVLNDIMNEVRKSDKDGRYEDKIDGQITIRLAKEGLKLTLTAKTQVVVKEVHKDEFAAISADPKQPELPGIQKKAPAKTITGGENAENGKGETEKTGDADPAQGGTPEEN